jgi:hypothetical protein
VAVVSRDDHRRPWAATKTEGVENRAARRERAGRLLRRLRRLKRARRRAARAGREWAER